MKWSLDSDRAEKRQRLTLITVEEAAELFNITISVLFKVVSWGGEGPVCLLFFLLKGS